MCKLCGGIKIAKEKLKILKPTMREKKHYLVVNARFDEVEKAVLKYLGVLGLAKSGLIFVKANDKYAICGANRKMINCIKSALAFSNLKCLYVSGLLRKAKEKAGIK